MLEKQLKNIPSKHWFRLDGEFYKRMDCLMCSEKEVDCMDVDGEPIAFRECTSVEYPVTIDINHCTGKERRFARRVLLEYVNDNQ